MTQLQDFDARTWRRIFLCMLRYQSIPDDIAFSYNRMEDTDDQIKTLYRKIIENETSKEAFWDGLMDTFSELVPAGHNRIDKTKEHEDIFLIINVVSFVQPQRTTIDHFKTLFSRVNNRSLLDVMYNKANLHFKLLSALIAFGDRDTTRDYMDRGIANEDRIDKPISEYPIFYEIALRYYLHFSPEKYNDILVKLLPAFALKKENAVYACRALTEYAASSSFERLFDFLDSNYDKQQTDGYFTNNYLNFCDCLYIWTKNREKMRAIDGYCRRVYDIVRDVVMRANDTSQDKQNIAKVERIIFDIVDEQLASPSTHKYLESLKNEGLSLLSYQNLSVAA